MTKWTKEQEEAIVSEGKNIIVSAGAGSGKTAVLTERVLTKVKKGISLSNLLILTFTKMAAKEMKERIGKKLKEEGLYEELNNLDSADITTFDAYSLSLVKKYHYYLNVSKDINVIDSSVIYLYKKEMLKIIFDNLYEEEDKDFLEFVKAYSIKDDKEIFEFILNLSNKLDLKLDKINYIDNYIDNYFNDEYINNSINEYTLYLKKLINEINNYLEYIDDDKYLDKLYESLKDLINANTYNEIIDNININLPRAMKVSDITKEYKEKINNNIKSIKKLCLYKNENEIKEGILSTKKYTSVILKILKELDLKVMEYKKEYDYYEYHDIAYFAIKLVKENIEVREDIKNNLNEILIDEYQDTNDIQEEFISYISNNNVYMVGDIKQSIYRFRNANPYIFKSKYDKYSREDNGIKIDLNKNFRSREEVINNINDIFNKIMDDDIGGASYKKDHQMIFGNNTYNEIGFNNQNNNIEVYNYLNTSNFKKEEIEAFIIAKDINTKIKEGYLIYDKDLEKNRKVKYSDFAILMDKSSNFDLYKKILQYNNINASIMKKSNLLDGEVIYLIKNIISFIIKIKNNIIDTEFKRLFMSIGRSFLFEIDDNTLFNYFVNNNFTDSSVYKISLEIAGIIDIIPINDIIDIIIEKYDFYNKLMLIGDYNSNIIRIDKLKEIVDSLVNLNYSIYDFNKYLNDIIDNDLKIEYDINDIDEDSVKIMTIHSSKGLEFSICYYSMLSSKFNIKEAISKFSYDDKYGIITPYKNDFIYNTIYHNLSYLNYIKENISERIRLFYVALTRAKEKMIFILPTDERAKESSINDIIDSSIREKYTSFASIMYSIEPILKKYYKSIDINSLNINRNYNMIKNNNYQKEINTLDNKINVNEMNINIKIDKEDTFSKKNIHLITKEEQEKLNYGISIHELFEYTSFKNKNNKEIINNFIKLIDLDYKNIYKEYEFIYEKDNTMYHGIIDLMLEYDEYINIIDYKLKNIEDEAYLKQLNGYKDYIKKLFKKDVNIYLYSIMNNNLEKI